MSLVFLVANCPNSIGLPWEGISNDAKATNTAKDDYMLFLDDIQLAKNEIASLRLIHRPGTESWFGYGWTIPFFEAKAYQASETIVEAVLPNGSTIRAPIVNSAEKETVPAIWRADLDEKLICVKAPDGTNYQYKNGLLQKIILRLRNMYRLVDRLMHSKLSKVVFPWQKLRVM